MYDLDILFIAHKKSNTKMPFANILMFIKDVHMNLVFIFTRSEMYTSHITLSSV